MVLCLHFVDSIDILCHISSDTQVSGYRFLHSQHTKKLESDDDPSLFPRYFSYLKKLFILSACKAGFLRFMIMKSLEYIVIYESIFINSSF